MTDSGTSGLNKIISPPLPDANTASVTIDAHGGVDANESVKATAEEKGSVKKAVEVCFLYYRGEKKSSLLQ